MPKIGDIKKDYEIGKQSHSNSYVWHACIDCGKERWVALGNVTRTGGRPLCLRCYPCAMRNIGLVKDQQYRHNGEKPEIGEIRRRRDINPETSKKLDKRIFIACVDCGKERWVDYRDGA